MKFIHAADLHIDSPLRGLQRYDGAPHEQLRGATRESLKTLVTLAIEEDAAFVMIAGDLFDGPWQDMQTGVWTANQFRRLREEDIPVYLIRGNHDAESRVEKAVSWPENVFEFSTTRPETVLREDLGIALHGQGFATRDVVEDLAASYPERVDGLFNIGLLHTSLTGFAEHDNYAPTNEDVLRSRGYDYWALGHVHNRQMISEHPYIAFPGNTQGRHIRESGAKGCLVVSVEDGHLESTEFRATDVLRWERLHIQLEPRDRRDDLLNRVRQRMESAHRTADDRFLAVRISIRGSCDAHHQCISQTDRAAVCAEIRNQANDFHGDLWVEKIQFDTRPAVDILQLREGSDLVGELLRGIQELQSDETQLRELGKALSPLTSKAAPELSNIGVDVEDVGQLRNWMRAAEGILVSHFLESDA